MSRLEFYSENQMRTLTIDELLCYIADCCNATRQGVSKEKLRMEVKRAEKIIREKQRRQLKVRGTYCCSGCSG